MRLSLRAILLIAVFAAGCGRSAELARDERVRFVRGGVVVPAGQGGVEADISWDNGTAHLRDGVALADGTFFYFPWKPQAEYAIEIRSAKGETLSTVKAPSPLRPEPAVVAAPRLESVRAGSVTAGGEPDAALAFSDDGTLVAAGTFGGYVRVFDTETGRQVFEKRLPGAVVKRVAISADNARVYAGEMSVDGFIRAFDIGSRRELWRFRLADELGTSKPARPDDFFALYAYPQAYCMRAIGEDLLVDGFHSWNDGGAPRHLSRLYRFSGPDGYVRWKFPPDAPIARNISWFDTDGRTVAFSAYQWERPGASDNVPQAALYLVDLHDGSALDVRAFEPLKPFFDTTPMWYGLAQDGEGRVALGLMDGRAAIFRTQPFGGRSKPALAPVRELDLATPIDVTGVPVYAGCGWAAASGGALFLLTDGRLVAPSASAKGKTVRADHFNSNTLFAFDAESGRLLWQWKLITTAQSVAAGHGVVAVATQQSYSSDDPMDYGITVFDPLASGAPVDKMLFRYSTAGPIVALAVSPDGSKIAAVEAPVRLADGLTVVGAYRLHIVR